MTSAPVSSEPRWNWKRVARRTRVPLGFLFAALYLWLAQPSLIAILSGAVVVALGLAVRAAAAGHVKKDRVLTVTGPYRFVRHPLYAGSSLIGIGFAIASRSLWIVAAIVIMFIAIYWPVMLSEEEYLRANFEGYDDYSRRIPRLIPGLRPLPAESGSFSRELYMRHREYQAMLGALALFAALAIKMVWHR